MEQVEMYQLEHNKSLVLPKPTGRHMLERKEQIRQHHRLRNVCNALLVAAHTGNDLCCQCDR